MGHFIHDTLEVWFLNLPLLFFGLLLLLFILLRFFLAFISIVILFEQRDDLVLELRLSVDCGLFALVLLLRFCLVVLLLPIISIFSVVSSATLAGIGFHGLLLVVVPVVSAVPITATPAATSVSLIISIVASSLGRLLLLDLL